MTSHTGRHFLQIPGPTNVPDRVLRAIDQPTIDHRGPEFAALGHEVLSGMKAIFKTRHPVIIYPASENLSNGKITRIHQMNGA